MDILVGLAAWWRRRMTHPEPSSLRHKRVEGRRSPGAGDRCGVSRDESVHDLL